MSDFKAGDIVFVSTLWYVEHLDNGRPIFLMDTVIIPNDDSGSMVTNLFGEVDTADVFTTPEAAATAGRAHARAIAARLRAEAERAASVFDAMGEEK